VNVLTYISRVGGCGMDSFSVGNGLMVGCCVQCSIDRHRGSGGYPDLVTVAFLKLLVGKNGVT
jgi:hypothetical protein